ncbi:MAG TPA: PilZ domain-containing protein [Pyrinomonadaceae bacterium]|nr:PilZ domain-containing protein [Pyrinomonadaceae bacterium]
MENERREDKRASVSLEAWWEGQSGRHQARVSDLSMGGCFIDTLSRAEIGEVIVFAIKRPNGKWLQLRGEVASVDEHVGFSLAFTYLTEDEQLALAPLVKT